MSEQKMISARVEREYDFVRNQWDNNVFFQIHDSALYSFFLAEISPMQLHTLVTLALFMDESGKIEISVADMAKALSISFHQVNKRIEDLLNFRFRDKPIIHVTRPQGKTDSDKISVEFLPISPITIHDGNVGAAESVAFTPQNPDYLYGFLQNMMGVQELSDADREILKKLQDYPLELPPQVIEVLIEHVFEYKGFFDRQYLMTIATSWSFACIQTKEQAVQWIEETSKFTSAVQELDAKSYLTQYLRDRLKRQPTGTQIGIIHQLLEKPYEFEPGCVEVLIEHVISQQILSKGKPDFPKRYVEVIAQEWLERGVRTRQTALEAIAEWNASHALQLPNTSADTKERPLIQQKREKPVKVRSSYIEKLRKAGAR
ncbi:hypothetical protein DNHGIG_35930 [Collibacillus ludicampi]|uniref:DnaB/C C-terminal domain-containing protein n=1 Tax=Collibacillus ludicampi TaxID=2771369 RepID=A0AAV4LJJ8_9BACL|nr:DnaD domain protein [Collibacillus ludicampi]GIM48044.1 hypothetical protein DNHGIG_35930 [Collibacillus ludicampi]